MKIEVKTGDILNERSDVLICSANVYLNQSGGVGGEILRRYGNTMQQALREQLRSAGRQFVNQGDLIETPGFDTGFKYVLHAVAVNVWYETSAEIVQRLLVNAFARASALNSTKVTTAALGTGYGRRWQSGNSVGGSRVPSAVPFRPSSRFAS